MNCQQTNTHTIKEGDSLYLIARMHKMTLEDIIELNPNVNPYNLQVGTQVVICDEHASMPVTPKNQPDNMFLNNQMRRLWEQHVYWTRMLLMSIAAGLGDTKAVTDRLMQNPRDISNLFAQYVTLEQANQLEQLLSTHLTIGAEIITALKNGNRGRAEQLNRQWYRNADEIATALANMNSNYDLEMLREMLYRHLGLTAREVVERLSGNYAADIDVFDVLEWEILSMADYLTQGLMRM